MRRYGRVVLGGTFDRLHVGHEALLATAFRLGRSVAIGVTTDAFLSAHPKPRGGAIAPERSRRRALERWLRSRYPRRAWTVVPLADPFGRSTEAGVDALVVSSDTLAGGKAVNRERRRQGRPVVPLIVVPLALADDLEPVSSRRIRSGEIDRAGHRRAPIAVRVVVGDRADLPGAVRGVRRAFRRARVRAGASIAVHGSPRSAAARLVARTRLADGLGVAVVRTGRRGWVVAVRGRATALDPRNVPGRAPSALAAGIARILRPAPPKPL